MTRVLVVGNPDPVHVGSHFVSAGRQLGLDVRCVDTRTAFDGPAWRQKASWWLRGHRPVGLGRFSQAMVGIVRQARPDLVLATGLAPLDASALAAIRREGVACANFLTDDPWNPAHHAPWFMDSLAGYDTVFTPRRANIRDLERLGGPLVHYLPFAYNPDVHYPEAWSAERAARYGSDVMLAGGADADRIGLVAPLIGASFDVALYGGYWHRHALTRGSARGHVDLDGLRLAVAHAGVCLGIVRRANRDGHAMRSFEVPAMGGCLLVENTDDHRRLFGPDGECVAYFDEAGELAEKVADLLARPDDRRRMADAARRRVVDGGHDYNHRLTDILARMSDQVSAVGPAHSRVAG